MNILVFTPHPDDEILGAGGTIAKKAKDGNNVFVCIVTSGQPPVFSSAGIVIVQKETKEVVAILGAKDIFFEFPCCNA